MPLGDPALIDQLAPYKIIGLIVASSFQATWLVYLLNAEQEAIDDFRGLYKGAFAYLHWSTLGYCAAAILSGFVFYLHVCANLWKEIDSIHSVMNFWHLILSALVFINLIFLLIVLKSLSNRKKAIQAAQAILPPS